MRTAPVVVPATEELVRAIAPRVRLVDCIEFTPRGDVTEDLLLNLRSSSHAWCWLVDGAPVCLWGVTPMSIAGSSATVWVATTEEIRADLRTFLLGSRIMLRHLLTLYPRLEGYVDARFTDSVRWLERLGFELQAPINVRGVPIRYFEKS